jgi:hypothetical protein
MGHTAKIKPDTHCRILCNVIERTLSNTRSCTFVDHGIRWSSGVAEIGLEELEVDLQRGGEGGGKADIVRTIQFSMVSVLQAVSFGRTTDDRQTPRKSQQPGSLRGDSCGADESRVVTGHNE